MSIARRIAELYNVKMNAAPLGNARTGVAGHDRLPHAAEIGHVQAGAGHSGQVPARAPSAASPVPHPACPPGPAAMSGQATRRRQHLVPSQDGEGPKSARIQDPGHGHRAQVLSTPCHQW